VGEEMADSILRTTCDFHGKCTDLLHVAKLRHGTGGFTSLPSPSPEKSDGFSRVPEASMLTTRPLKPLTNTHTRPCILKLDVHESVHHDIIMKTTNKMQLCRLIYYSLSALRVSGDVFAHHQEHLTVFTASGSIHQCSCRLVS
jgi:hypothetical protein